MDTMRVLTDFAAKLIGISPTRLRCRMKMDYKTGRNPALPIGRVIPPNKEGKQYTFVILKPLLMKYLGLTEWPEEWDKEAFENSEIN